MRNLKALDENLTVNLNELDICFRNFWNELSECINSIEAKSAISNRSISLKKAIIESTANIANLTWISKTRDGQGPFQIDANYECTNCRDRHIVNLVFCLNNREAIGSNFLKLEVSAISQFSLNEKHSHQFQNTLGVLVTFDRQLLEEGKWDPAYADASEYGYAMNKYFRPVFKSNLIALRIHLI